MPADATPVWAELVQLVPIISLAFPFVVQGQVDVAAAGPAMAVASVLSVPAMGAVLWRGHVLNPILVGTNLWLWIGALGLGLPIPALAAWITEAQAWGLFAGALLVGVVVTAIRPGGYIGCRHDDPAWIRRTSLILLAFTALVCIWAWMFRHDVRLGGGLPFIVLNFARRVTILRAP